MTSNLGSDLIQERFGELDYSHMKDLVLGVVSHNFRPEFINRIDEKVVFHHLTQENMRDVVKIMVKPLIATLAEKDITLKFQPSALKYLAEAGYDPEMGARPLRRTIQDKVEDKLSELILSGNLASGNTLKIGVSKGQLKFDIA